MSRQDGIKIEGAIIEVLNGRLYRVELPNGHRLLAHLPGRRAEQFSPAALAGGKAGPSKREMAVARAPELKFEVGDRVTVEMSPFDFSKGRIRLEER
jgi:translation initiation factor IF-1